MRRLATLALAAWTLATAASAQEWQVQRERGLTAALAVWPSGHALVIRCQEEDFQVFLRLPNAVTTEGSSSLNLEGQTRQMSLALPYGAEEGAVLFAQEPARAARWLADGGALTVDAAGQSAVVLTLPVDGEPIRQALLHCNRPLQSPRDNYPRATNPQWVQRPEVRDFMRALDISGMPEEAVVSVVLSCRLRADGRLEDCEVEQETPAGFEVAEAWERAALRSLLERPTPENVGAVVVIPFRFHLGD
jgi:hypothetical protein